MAVKPEVYHSPRHTTALTYAHFRQTGTQKEGRKKKKERESNRLLRMLPFLKLGHRSLQASMQQFFFFFLNHGILLASHFHLTNSFQVFDPFSFTLIPIVKSLKKKGFTFQVNLFS